MAVAGASEPSRTRYRLPADLSALAVSLVLVALVAATGAIVNAGAVDGWYAEADKPAGTPPGWVFGPVWTALYAAMAVAAWLVWRTAGSRGATVALSLYAVQLALNAAWTPVFFGAERLYAGLAVIVLLDLAIAGTALAFRRKSRVASLLLVPYLAWSLFATYLNAGIATLNR